MSDSREQFEATAKAQGLSVTRTHQALAFANGSRRSAGDYIAIETVCAWWAWQASRQALVIELPPAIQMPEEENDDFEEFETEEAIAFTGNGMRAACRFAIEAAGVRVKE